MNSNLDKLKKKIIQDLAKKEVSSSYERAKINFNPFPASGIARHPSLEPLNNEINTEIINFISAAYNSVEGKDIGDYAGLTIVGEFGSGKTHTMQYLKYLIEQLSDDEKSNLSAITCFIDRPEDSPQKVIHRIVENIGMDNLRKYIWKVIIENLKKKNKEELIRMFKNSNSLFFEESNFDKLFEEPNISSNIKFLNLFEKIGCNIEKLKDESSNIIKNMIDDDILVERYLSLIFPNKKSVMDWNVLAGYVSSTDMKRKEIHFLNSIVKILRESGYKQLFVFIDEFEDVSKLKGAKLSDYVLTLNTLINSEKHWAVVVSLTQEALEK
ncbi:MAG: hypothetical protein KC589_11310, partial [Nanoarchaeota archaeon]|nr:hypothetical protein [Nanoarchaeota archaeon]